MFSFTAKLTKNRKKLKKSRPTKTPICKKNNDNYEISLIVLKGIERKKIKGKNQIDLTRSCIGK